MKSPLEMTESIPPSSGEHQVEFLVRRAAGGDKNAFDQLMNRCWAEIFRMVYYRTFSRLDAEDLTQEIFMRAYAHIKELRRPDRFRAWLFSIAVNIVRDFQRKKRWSNLFQSPLESGDELEAEPETQAASSPLNDLIRQEFWDEVREFTEELPGSEKEVFILRFMDHFAIREIAVILNKHESTIKTHLYRAVRKFNGKARLIKMLREE